MNTKPANNNICVWFDKQKNKMKIWEETALNIFVEIVLSIGLFNN